MKKRIVMIIFFCLITASFFVSAGDSLQVWVKPTAHFETNENVTIGGKAIDTGSGTALSGRDLTVRIVDPNGDVSVLHDQNLTTDSSGKFTSSDYTGTSISGKYSVISYLYNVDPLIPPTVGAAFFYVEPEREYKVETDKFIYEPGENVTITITVNDVDANGTKTPAANENVPLKVFNEAGTLVVDSPSITTGSSGTVSINYTVPVTSS
ncbi:hypothetical protein GF327_04095, partial [Candidatus Woesearchaeota archaeon]|nr:hypothetical protein [Candidatus Woesearchaeota archaeon]